VSDATAQFVFPKTLVTRVDLARMVREIESIDNDMAAQRARAKTEKAAVSAPATSKILAEFLEMNKLDIVDDHQRTALKDALRHFKDVAPIVHMVFASDPSPDVLHELTEYLRTNIHPQSLISVGLQPGLIGGVYIRTPNHVHDFSIRSLLKSKRDVMVRQLEAFRG
jgi:F0F1-type ATP synthase delta subunit